MKLFECQGCRNTVHFENSVCVACRRQLGYAPERGTMTALEPAQVNEASPALLAAVGAPEQRYHFCANAAQGVCNWLVHESDGHSLCRSCRHNDMAPDLTVAGNRERWARLEQAKRQLFYSLLLWGLPTPIIGEDAREPLVFDLIGDVHSDQGVKTVLTGHDFGRITLNIAEADDDVREQRRVAMGEPYRTPLGHFRHEIGHYYWDLLVRDGGPLAEFRALFGDERGDYDQALQAYYANGAPRGWRESFISAYATAHPWEDFAETWAHYMHIVDTLETACSFGISLKPRHVANDHLEAAVDFDAYRADRIERILDAWTPISVAVNSLSRSLGQGDVYPFVLSQAMVGKLSFIHRLIGEQRARQTTRAAA
ncbi:hypothetical protein CCR94_15710 [Rhodoblastus sphagnicola]|uniref:Zinc-ribbon domain-containing protein n=1 Tax=Rhodoblastus sphagnicola TaxID=333368 RepID=A0A2S6N3W9_9HYPH|nr:putative zinc-binding peptidase [Rhodoblastus sphagnicola]MBB4198942.1 hypothetical protein [Rhodoblastus sphagnicola]PPQ29257.1 hypothetical protein CCR94_15710 [Rhodoblastus sphagnicola]